MTAEHSQPAEDADQTAKRLRSALLGASVRGDTSALDDAIREAATRCGISEQHTLAAWVRRLFAESGIEEEYLTAELQKLPRETLAGIAFQIARIIHTDPTPSSRAS